MKFFLDILLDLNLQLGHTESLTHLGQVTLMIFIPVIVKLKHSSLSEGEIAGLTTLQRVEKTNEKTSSVFLSLVARRS